MAPLEAGQGIVVQIEVVDALGVRLK